MVPPGLVFEKTTLPVPGLKVPPKLFHAPLPPLIVRAPDAVEVKMPAVSMVKVLISVEVAITGGKGTVEASGMTT